MVRTRVPRQKGWYRRHHYRRHSRPTHADIQAVDEQIVYEIADLCTANIGYRMNSGARGQILGTQGIVDLVGVLG